MTFLEIKRKREKSFHGSAELIKEAKFWKAVSGYEKSVGKKK